LGDEELLGRNSFSEKNLECFIIKYGSSEKNYIIYKRILIILNDKNFYLIKENNL